MPKPVKRSPADEAAARLRADNAVMKALLKKAKGYSYVQEEGFKCKIIEYDDAGKKVREDEAVRVIEVKKHMPPDYDSILFWLKSRRPDEWSREGSANAGAPIIDDVPPAPILTAEEMAALAAVHSADADA